MGTPGPCGTSEGGIELTGEGGVPVERGKAARHFFGRRRGRPLSALQAALLEAHRQAVRLPMDGAVASAHDLRRIFAAAVDDVWLEIGFGGGEHLLTQARRHPGVGMIGVEPFVNGFASAVAATASDPGVKSRMRLYNDDVTPVLDWLPDASIGRAFMLFPDPWPRKRHRNRRLLSAGFLEKLSRVLRPGAEFRFASDIASYTAQAVALINADPSFGLLTIQRDVDRPQPEDWPVTRYERKANAAGRTSSYITASRLRSTTIPHRDARGTEFLPL